MTKALIAVYIDTSGLDPSKALAYCEQMKSTLNLETLTQEEYKILYIPSFTKIEVLPLLQ
jgi:hypothetical protein